MSTYIHIDKAEVESLRAILERRGAKAVVLPHTAPDGDAIGSIVAWRETLALAYPELEIYAISPDTLEAYLMSVPMAEDIILYPEDGERALRLIEEADIIFHLDHNQASRLRYAPLIEAVERSRAKRILIDHHLQPEEGMELYFSYPEASSTCELVYCLIKAMGLSQYISPRIATALTYGIVTDTGRFMYGCFAPELYQHFSELLAHGADYPYIIDSLSYHGTLTELKLKGYMLHEKLEIYPELRAAILSLSQAEIQAMQITKGDTEGLVNMPLSVEGIDCVCFVREDKSQVKISLRSIGSLSVNEIARRAFGGGGHLNAAGGEHQGSIDTARQLFLDTLRAYLSSPQV